MAAEKNPISRLQEICHQWKQPLPVYRECQGSYSEFGTEITVNIDGEGFTFRAKGRTKKVSKANVAEEALKYVQEHKAYLLEPPAQALSCTVVVCRSHVEVKGHGECHVNIGGCHGNVYLISRL